jgi:MFS family permease
MRALQGIGTAFNMTSIYSLVATEFPNEREKYFGYIEMSLGIGMFAGPFMSGILYQYIGYFGTFMMFAVILMIGVVIDFFLLPSRLNNKYDNNTNSDLKPSSD